jgi:hypothetical protein
VELSALPDLARVPEPELAPEPALAPEPDLAPEPEPDPAPAAKKSKPAPAKPGGNQGFMFKREMSALEYFFHQLDEFLRDPSLSNALRAFRERFGAGLREMGSQVAEAVRRAARAIAALRLSRRLLLGLLALLLPLALLALLLGSGDEEPRTASERPAQAQAQPGGAGLGGVGMPALAAAPDRVPAATVALVVDGSLTPAALRRELAALGSWLATSHAPGTRVALIDATTGRASAPLGAAQLARAGASRPHPSTSAAIDTVLAREGGRRLLVNVGTSASSSRRASTLNVATRPGATPAPSVALARGGTASVTIDERRPNALAASVARALMEISGQRERR